MQALLVEDTAVVASNPESVFDKAVAAIVRGDAITLTVDLQSCEVHVFPHSHISC
jgi:hypothetical protein